MRSVTLDCTKMTNDVAVHDIFAEALDFPAYYGRNLDALYDQLTSCSDLELTLANVEALGKLFRYGDNLLLALRDAAKDNPRFILIEA